MSSTPTELAKVFLTFISADTVPYTAEELDKVAPLSRAFTKDIIEIYNNDDLCEEKRHEKK